MHHITRMEVDGFWETYEVSLRLFPEVTFLIGQNGTGKTTIINLLAAALTADFRTLDRIPFKKVSVYLSPTAEGNEPRITVIKSKRKERPFELIEYRISSGSKNTHELRFSLEDIEEQALVRRFNADPRYLRDFYRFMPSSLNLKLHELVNVNWLSVHRAPITSRAKDEVSYESTVDQRLADISNELVRFFSTLSGQKDNQIKAFQEYIFVSLLERDPEADIFSTRGLEDINKYRNTLSQIFDELRVSQINTSELIDSFVKQGNAIRKSYPPDERAPLQLHDALYLFGFRRISAVVQRWFELQKELSEIFAPRDNWLRIANQLFQRKKMEITSSNELQFVSRTGKILKPQMLSSGEKQLLILLSETLLQREQRSIFIADEPELSLHVVWQEKLVASLRALNPHAQIIAATHSPDIVGPLADRAIDMETIIP